MGKGETILNELARQIADNHERERQVNHDLVIAWDELPRTGDTSGPASKRYDALLKKQERIRGRRESLITDYIVAKRRAE